MLSRLRRIAAAGAVLVTVPSTLALCAPQANAASASDVVALARANISKHTCDTNSLGGTGFENSCAADDWWCADFVKWVWQNSGLDVAGLDSWAGHFVLDAGQNGSTVHEDVGYVPHPGDAVVFNYNSSTGYADHVGMVTQLNSDGTMQVINGDSGDTTTPKTSTVNYSTGAAHVGASIWGQTVSAFVTPAGLTSSSALTAFQSNIGALDTFGAGGQKTSQGMRSGTSPSMTRLAGGGHEEAFQANTGALIAFGDLVNVNTGLGMMAGTSPAIASSGSSIEIAMESNTGELILWTPAGGPVHTGQGMKVGTSPAIAAKPGGGYDVAFQANTGELLVYGYGHTGQGMMNGTNPSIAATTSGFEVAFEANTGELVLWAASATSGASSHTGQGMKVGTSPAIAAKPGGGYTVAFQANTGELLVYGYGHTGQGMMAGTNPTIATTASGFEVAFQANTGELVLWTGSATTGASTHTAQGMLAGTSPAIIS